MELTNDFLVSAPPPTAFAVLTDVERIAPMLPGAQLQEIEGDDFRGLVKVKVGPITAQYKGTASFQERDESAGRVVLRASGRDTRGQGNASATITATLAADGDGTRVKVVTDLTITGKVAQFGRGVLADVSAKLIGQFVEALEADLQKGDAPKTSAPSTAAEPVPATAGAEPAASDAGEHAGRAAEAAGTSPGAGAPAEPAADAAAVSPGAMVPEAPSDTAPPGAEPTTAPSVAADTAAAATRPAVRRIDSPEPDPVDLLDAAGGSVAKRLVPVLGGVGALLLLLLIGRRRRR